MPAPDSVLPRMEITVFHHLVTVGTTKGKGTDSYLPSLRHDDLPQKPFFIAYLLIRVSKRDIRGSIECQVKAKRKN